MLNSNVSTNDTLAPRVMDPEKQGFGVQSPPREMRFAWYSIGTMNPTTSVLLATRQNQSTSTRIVGLAILTGVFS